MASKIVLIQWMIYCITVFTVIQTVICQNKYHKDCSTDEYGTNYKGSINTTITGRKCQRWDTNDPHETSYRAVNSSNYCRDPTGHAEKHILPWCYTTDRNYRWDFCPVYQCGTHCSKNFFMCNNGTCIIDHWRCNGKSDCSGSEDELDCKNVRECLEDNRGLSYRGTINVTKSGKICQSWASQKPHTHTDEFLGNNNHCRNYKLNYEGPWCYTMDSNVIWDYCDIPKCVLKQECLKGVSFEVFGTTVSAVILIAAMTVLALCCYFRKINKSTAIYEGLTLNAASRTNDDQLYNELGQVSV